MLGYILISVIIVGLISFIGILFISMSQRKIDRMIILFIAMAAGAFIGDSFFHLIPESLESFDAVKTFLIVIFGFALFFAIESFLFYRHCHETECKAHPFTYLSLVGDAVHNFIDGILIASSYLVSPLVGFTTTIAIVLHEIPQEIGDYYILVHGGFTKSRAVLLNFFSALTAIGGALIGYFVISDSLVAYTLPLTAGMFLYLGASDLIPEIHRERSRIKYYLSLVFFLLGIAMMYCLLFFE